jgi:hypothetical protein
MGSRHRWGVEHSIATAMEVNNSANNGTSTSTTRMDPTNPILSTPAANCPHVHDAVRVPDGCGHPGRAQGQQGDDGALHHQIGGQHRRCEDLAPPEIRAVPHAERHGRDGAPSRRVPGLPSRGQGLERRVRDSNPRYGVHRTAVFKTATFGRSVNPPSPVSRRVKTTARSIPGTSPARHMMRQPLARGVLSMAHGLRPVRLAVPGTCEPMQGVTVSYACRMFVAARLPAATDDEATGDHVTTSTRHDRPRRTRSRGSRLRERGGSRGGGPARRGTTRGRDLLSRTGQRANSTSRPRWGCSASGTNTVPSARWCCSTSAMMARCTASAVPLSVCTSRLSPPATRIRHFNRRA